MNAQAPAQYEAAVVDPNCVPRPYPARTEKIPTSMDERFLAAAEDYGTWQLLGEA